jgi:transporter family-2 protein
MPSLAGATRRSVLLAGAASAAAGVLLGVLVRVNATLGTHLGEFGATFAVHVVGTAFALLLVAPRAGRGTVQKLAEAPPFDWSGGLWSIAMVWVATVVVPQLGTALAVSLFVASDLFFSAAADAIGGRGRPRVPLSGRRVAGLALALAGVLLVRFG